MELMKLFFTPDEALYNKTIDDVLSDEFYQSNFWLYWQTMFAFETWHSALEMKLSLPYKMALHAGLDALRGTTLEELLAQYDLI